MIERIISFFMAVIMSLTGLGNQATAAGIKQVFANAYSLLATRSDFIDGIGDDDISCFTDNDGYIKNMMLIFFEEDASFFNKLGSLRKIGGTVIGSMPKANLCVVATRPMNYEQLTAECEKAADFDGIALASICPAKRYEEQYTPNDPFTHYDWYTESWNEANPAGNNWWLEATQTRAAWGYSSYFEKINIGIVDGGFEVEHDDLAGKITFPTAKEAGRNRSSYHGTHVAGIIAAKGDNGVGISGICQNSNLICVDWSPSDMQLWIGDVAIFFGFGKIVEAGAKVLNFSLGSSGTLGAEASQWPAFIRNLDAMLYSCYMAALLKNGYDFLVVQSAGNGNSESRPIDAISNGCFCPINEKNAFIPYSGISAQDLIDRIIVVGSATMDGGSYVQSASSNVGDRVDICAPGVSIYSCVTENDYMTLSGTSMAAPVVSGIASLVWSADSNLSGAEVKEIICTNTRDTVAPAEEYYFADKLKIKSYPLVNAKLAVEAALENKYLMNSITVTASPDTTVVFKTGNAAEFVFETDINGSFNCLLEGGEYSVIAGGEDWGKVTVDGDESFDFSANAEPETPEEAATEE